LLSDYVLIRHKSVIFGRFNIKVMEKNTQMANVNDSFTAKEEKFCYEYCIDLNATKAAIRAGYSGKTARSISSTLLTKVNIQKKIKETQSDLQKAAGISALRSILAHKQIAFSNIGHYFDADWKLKNIETLSEDQKACIQEVKVKDTKDGKEVNFKLFSKAASLDAICKLLDFYAPVKNEVTGKDGKDLFPNYDLSLLDDTESKVFNYLIRKAAGTEPYGKWLCTFQEGIRAII